jgi:HK97 family phage major capsid protein
VPYNNIIDATDAGALIPGEQANEVIKAAVQASAALTLCRAVRMSSKTFSQPVLSAAPVAYWVTTGLKQTAEAAWQGVELTAEEIATIIPVKDDVLADSGFPIWDELRAPIGEAFARVLDAAVFAGTNKPASWPTALIPGAEAAGNTNTANATAAEGGIITDLGELLDMVEADGFDPSAYAASRSLRGLMRKARSTTGESLGEGSTTSVWDLPIQYAVAGSFPVGPPASLALAGDYSMAVVGLRQDMTFELFREGVITDAAGVIQHNLLQEDKSAMRVTFRVGFAVAVPVTTQEAGAGTRYPFAVLKAAA